MPCETDVLNQQLSQLGITILAKDELAPLPTGDKLVIHIGSIQELNIFFANGDVLYRKEARMIIDKSQTAHTVGIQSQGDVGDNATVTQTIKETSPGFDRVIQPFVDAMKEANLSSSQTAMLSLLVNTLREEAAKPKEKQDKSAIEMALSSIKAAVSVAAGLAPLWSSISKSVLEWFSPAADTSLSV